MRELLHMGMTQSLLIHWTLFSPVIGAKFSIDCTLALLTRVTAFSVKKQLILVFTVHHLLNYRMNNMLFLLYICTGYTRTLLKWVIP